MTKHKDKWAVRLKKNVADGMTGRDVHIAFNTTGDMLSDASPNRSTDPKSFWARKRALKNITPKQTKEFALAALPALEYFFNRLY